MKNENNQNTRPNKTIEDQKKKIKITIANVDEKDNENLDNHNKSNIKLEIISDSNEKIQNSIILENRSKNTNHNNDNNKENKDIFNITKKIYLNEEHFSQKMLFGKKNSSQSHLLNLNKFLSNSNINKNEVKKSSRSRFSMTKDRNIYNISQIKEEENENNKKSFVSCQRSTSGQIKKKNNVNAFFKLKEKTKKPPKVYYIDSIIRNFNNSKNICDSTKNNIKQSPRSLYINRNKNKTNYNISNFKSSENGKKEEQNPDNKEKEKEIKKEKEKEKENFIENEGKKEKEEKKVKEENKKENQKDKENKIEKESKKKKKVEDKINVKGEIAIQFNKDNRNKITKIEEDEIKINNNNKNLKGAKKIKWNPIQLFCCLNNNNNDSF